MSRAKVGVLAAFTIMLFLGLSQSLTAQFRGARDPGVRGGPDGAGDMLPNLTAEQQEMFTAGQADFSEEEEVDEGVGPRFNFVSCAGCHAQPAVGGSSPAANPLFRVNDPADLKFVNNTIPSFITKNGPVREARFQFNADGSRDGGVHALFVISGHPDAAGCNIRQENFETQVQNRNIILRVPTPVFGAGLIESITDGAITANLASNSSAKSSLGISGRPNRNGNDGRIAPAGRSPRRRVPDRAAVGPRQARVLPARRSHQRPRGGDQGAPEQRQHEVRAVGGQPGHRQLQPAERRRSAGSAELLAVAVALRRITAGAPIAAPRRALHKSGRPRRASSPSRSSSRVRAEIPPGTVQKISNSSPSGSFA